MRVFPSPLRGGVRGGGNPDATNGSPASLATKSFTGGPYFAFDRLGQPSWAPRDYAAFAREGFMQNAILYRSVRMIAEAAASVPLLLYQGDDEIAAHPLLDLIARPNPASSAPDLLESWYGFLLVSGNAYLEAVAVGSDTRSQARAIIRFGHKGLTTQDAAAGHPRDRLVAQIGEATRLLRSCHPGISR